MDLLATTAALVGIHSVSRHEGSVADYVEAALRSNEQLEVVRVGDNVVACRLRPRRTGRAGRSLGYRAPTGQRGTPHGGRHLVGPGLGGHEGGPGRDARPGLQRHNRRRGAGLDVTYVFYVAEEIAREHSGLLALSAARPDLLEATAAVVCEPTGCAVQAGCQGVLKAELVMRGLGAHVARPWTGRNAIHRLAPVLDALGSCPPRQVEIDGCTYRESLQAVRVWGARPPTSCPIAPRLNSITASRRIGAPVRQQRP